jgi:hypothetical protein
VDLVIVAGVLFMILFMQSIGGIFFFKKRNKKNEEREEQSHEGLLCRYVVDGIGRKIGESIAVDEDILIIKSGKKYLGVPLKHIEEEERTLLVKGLVDKDKAEVIGEKWRLKSHREIE